MRNTFIKFVLAAFALCALSACGPSKEELAAKEALAKHEAYQKRMRDNNIRIFGREAIEKSEREATERLQRPQNRNEPKN